MSNSTNTASPAPPELESVQRWMQAVITHPDGVLKGADSEAAQQLINAGAGNLESVVTRSRKLDAADRLAIYANAYYARLLDCLGEVFPILKRTLGEEVFNGFGFGYLQSYPSQSYTLQHLGQHFITYLDETRPDNSDSDSDSAAGNWTEFLIDLARLEWTIYDVFDGPGLESVEASDLPDFLELSQANWLDLRIETAPCLQLLSVEYPVNDHYTAVRATDDEIELAFPQPARQYLAISRRDYVVRRYQLNRTQFALLEALQEGLTLGDALERCLDIAEQDSDSDVDLETDLPQWFRNWSAEICFFAKVTSPQP